MTTLKKTIHNVATGETITRDYTASELLEFENDKAEAEKAASDKAKAEEAKDRKRQEVLDRLGITAEELKTILS